MKFFKSVAQIFLLLCAFSAAGDDTNSISSLQARLQALMDLPRFAHAQWGAKVISLDTGVTIFERNAEKLMKPASNTKLYTAALALERLGPDFRIKTSFYARAKPDAEGVIHGDLLVYGRGDPSFSARFNKGDYHKALQPAIDALLSAGVKKIDGGIIGDESYFRGLPFGTDWTWDDLQEYYGAPASALTYQDYVIDLIFKPGRGVGESCQIVTMPETTILAFSNRTRTVSKNSGGRIRLYRPIGESVVYLSGRIPEGAADVSDSVSVPHPALWFAVMLKEGLTRAGVSVAGDVSERNWLDRQAMPINWTQLVEVASVESRPLGEIVKETLKPSENLYAQLLLLQVGAQSEAEGRQRGRTTEAEGLAEMSKFLRLVGIDAGETQIEEGSGLSRACLVTPDATVRLLVFMERHRWRDTFVTALPIAGVDGTLRKRFKGTPAAGNIHAKTGSLEGVDTLSGYLKTAGNERLAFSLMLNNYHAGPGADGRPELDAAALMLCQFSGHSTEKP